MSFFTSPISSPVAVAGAGLATPPAEVGAAMATAAATWQRLAVSGLSVSFGVDPATGRVATQLTDASGAVTATLTGAQTLALAGGELSELTGA